MPVDPKKVYANTLDGTREAIKDQTISMREAVAGRVPKPTEATGVQAWDADAGAWTPAVTADDVQTVTVDDGGILTMDTSTPGKVHLGVDQAKLPSGGATTVDGLTDATEVGKAVAKATDAAAARQAIDAAPSSSVMNLKAGTNITFDYDATTNSTTVNAPEQASGVTTVAELTDATDVGKAVATATDQAAARAAIGAADTATVAEKVASITVNGTTYTPTDGAVDLGTIAGGTGSVTTDSPDLFAQL